MKWTVECGRDRKRKKEDRGYPIDLKRREANRGVKRSKAEFDFSHLCSVLDFILIQ